MIDELEPVSAPMTIRSHRQGEVAETLDGRRALTRMIELAARRCEDLVRLVAKTRLGSFEGPRPPTPP